MADVNEKQIYEALGIEYSDAGENEQSPAETDQEAQQSAERGENEQDTAEPATAQEPSQETQDGQGDVQNAEMAEMDANTRRENAARRRRQEQQAAVDKAVEAALSQERQRSAAALESIFARAGLRNTITGEPIRTQEEFDQWEHAYRNAQITSAVESGHMTPEALEKAINEHPTVKKAEQVLAQAQQAEQQRQREAAQARLETELAQIHQLDPSIVTIGDLLKSPKGQEIYEKAKKGLGLHEAYYLVHRQDLEQAAAEKARQHSAMLSRSKEHLRPSGNSAGAGAVSVPNAEMQLYRMLMPNASDSEIQAHYNKHLKKH